MRAGGSECRVPRRNVDCSTGGRPIGDHPSLRRDAPRCLVVHVAFSIDEGGVVAGIVIASRLGSVTCPKLLVPFLSLPSH